MRKIRFFLPLLVLAALLAACTEPLEPTPVVDDPAKAIAAAKALLVEMTGVNPENILVDKVEPVEWGNACLDAPQFKDEMCAEVITPGFRIVLNANGQFTEIHTNLDGTAVRMAGGWGTSDIPEYLIVRQALAERLNASEADIRLAAVETVEFPDACLGLGKEGEMCAQVITPGYRLTLELGGAQYIYHTNIGGSEFRMADTP